MYAYIYLSFLSPTDSKARSIVANALKTEPAEVKRKRSARHAPSLSQSARSMGAQSLAVLLRQCFKSTYDRGTWSSPRCTVSVFPDLRSKHSVGVKEQCPSTSAFASG